MTIKIINAAEATVDNIVVMLYAHPNAGKTTLSFTASKPVLLDFDRGAHRAPNRADKDMVEIQSWADVAAMDPVKDFAGHDTVIVDTVGTCLDRMEAQLIREDPKNGTAGGALSLKGYGAMKSRFKSWLAGIREAGKDVVLIAHLKEEMRGDDTVERIDAAGSSKQEVYREADLIGRISYKGKNRVLTFNPTDASLGKNCGLPEMVLDDAGKNPNTLADIITQAKRMMNEAAQAGVDENKRLEELREWAKNLKGVDQFNSAVAQMVKDKARDVDKKILLDEGAARGFVFDKKAKLFTDPNAAQTAKDDSPEGSTF